MHDLDAKWVHSVSNLVRNHKFLKNSGGISDYQGAAILSQTLISLSEERPRPFNMLVFWDRCYSHRIHSHVIVDYDCTRSSVKA